MRQARFLVAGLVFILVYMAGQFAVDIWDYRTISRDGPADVAIVLGAATDGGNPSPVFEERLRHAVDLYHRSRVGRLLVTGGKAEGAPLSEAEVGRNWVVAQGVPADAVLIETESHTTRENLFNSSALLGDQVGKALVVSDPLHMRRAMWMAKAAGLDALPSPTPTTRYQTLGTQLPMLLREVGYCFVWLFAQQ